MTALLRATLDLVFPRRCLRCAATGEALCPDCARLLHEPLNRRVAGLQVLAATRYEPAVQAMIVGYKDRGRRDLLPVLAGFLVEALDRAPPAPIVGVPTSAAARRARGGDPLAVLARRVARLSGRPLCPALRLTRAVRDSVGLGVAARAQNLRGAMVAVPPLALRSPCVIVDDVVTSGTTLGESARALRAAGWRPTHAAAIALVERAAPSGPAGSSANSIGSADSLGIARPAV